jgi:phosphodiesterase/alkaline phosphatase D-like protein
MRIPIISINKISIRTSLLLLLALSCRKSDSDPGQNPDNNIDTMGSFTEILGRPTNSSVTMSILFDQPTDVFWELGTSSGLYDISTSTQQAAKDTPLEVDFINLVTNTKYYYRTRYRSGRTSTAFQAGTEHSFHTLRAPGSTFTFSVEADPHLDYNSDTAAFSLTLQNILSKNPDFMLDLGDTFMSEKQPMVDQKTVTERHLLFRPYFDKVCNSVPLNLVI